MEHVKWFINQGVAVAALFALLYIEYKRAGGISKLPKKIDELSKEVKELKEQIEKKQEE